MKQQSLRIAFVPKKRALFDRDGCPKQDAKRVAIHTNSSKSGKNVVPVSKTCQASPPPRSSLKSWLTASSVPGSNLGPETIKRSQERRLIRKTQQTTLDVAQRTLARPTKGLNTPPPKDAALKKMSNPQLDSSGEGPSTPLRVVHGPTKLAASSYTPYKCPTAITPRRKDITPARVSEKIGAGVNPGDIQIALNEHVAGNCCKADSGAVSPSSTPPMIHVNFSAPTTPQRSAAAVLLYLPNMTAPEDGAGHKARMRMMGRSPPKTMKQLGTTTRPMLSSRNLFGAARNSTPIFQNDVPDEATSDSFDLREKSVSLTAGTDSDEWAFVQNEATTCKISCPKQELTEVAKTGDPSVNLDVRVNIAASTMKDGADAGVSANGSAKSKIAYVSKIETVENVGMDKATTVGQNERATSEVPLSRSEKLFAAVAGKNKTTNTRASSRVQSSLAHVLPTTPTKSTHTYRDSSVSTHTHTHKSAHTQSHLDKDVVTTVGSGGTRLTEIQKQFTNRQIHRRLPPSYELLSQMQSALDLALRHRKARKENLTFERAKVWIEESLHKTFAEKHLKQIVSVWPEIYTLQRELSQKRTELQTAQTYRDKFMLLIDGDLSFTTPQGNTLPSSIRTIQQRQSLFRLLLLKRTLELHRTFVVAQGLTTQYDDEVLKTWHPAFDLDGVPDIEESDIPQPPPQQYESAVAVLSKAGELSETVRIALEKAAKEKVQRMKDKNVMKALPTKVHHVQPTETRMHTTIRSAENEATGHKAAHAQRHTTGTVPTRISDDDVNRSTTGGLSSTVTAALERAKKERQAIKDKEAQAQPNTVTTANKDVDINVDTLREAELRENIAISRVNTASSTHERKHSAHTSTHKPTSTNTHANKPQLERVRRKQLVPDHVMERVKAKGALKARQQMFGLSSDRSNELGLIERLPAMALLIHSIFDVGQAKGTHKARTVLPFDVVVEKMQFTYRPRLPLETMSKSVALLLKNVPTYCSQGRDDIENKSNLKLDTSTASQHETQPWLSDFTTENGRFLKINRGVSLSDVKIELEKQKSLAVAEREGARVLVRGGGIDLDEAKIQADKIRKAAIAKNRLIMSKLM